MAIEIITREELDKFKTELLDELLEELSEIIHLSKQRDWLKSHEVRELLGISPGTLQHLRVSGALPFAKVGGILFYCYEDIQHMLEKNKKRKG
ncbi:MAG: hypothetical protein JWO58_1927 [Chitinophagaceae bacterium]|nr:hypothetical protein [Chitinophagaceae bacterium]